MAFAFDNFRVASRSTHAEHSATYAYNGVNQMTARTVAGLLIWTMAYDAWERLASAVCITGGQTYTRTHTYWYGDKLKTLMSNAPGETPQSTGDLFHLPLNGVAVQPPGGGDFPRSNPLRGACFYECASAYSSEHPPSGGVALSKPYPSSALQRGFPIWIAQAVLALFLSCSRKH